MGISCNLEKRLFAHATGTGAMFLRRKGKLPFTLVFKKVFRTLQEVKKYERVAKSRKRFDV
jgi:predicted GIY-YIG superfamily endonuclease